MRMPGYRAEMSIYKTGEAYKMVARSAPEGLGVTLSQNNSCSICCGWVWETCCEVNCPPGQVARCNCRSTLFGEWPRCRCV